MPIYEYMCLKCGTMQELVRNTQERDSMPKCHCGGRCGRQPSLPYVRPERMYVTDPETGHRLVKNDSDNPWAGSGAEPEMQAKAEQVARVTKRQTKIQVDHGSPTNVAAVH